MAALRTQEPTLHHGRHAVDPRQGGTVARDVDVDHARVHVEQGLHQAVLLVGHVVALAVVALAVLEVALVQAAEDDDVVGTLRLRNGFSDELVGRAHLVERTPYGHAVVALHGVAHVATGIVQLAIGKPALDDFLQAVERQHLALYLQRTGASTHGHHLDGILAHHQDALPARQVERQQGSLHALLREETVLQQHDAFAGNLSGSGIVVVGAEEALCAMLVHRGAEVEAQHATHLLVERLQQVGLALAGGLVDELLVGLGHVVGVVGIGAAHGEPVGPRAELHVESVEDGFLGVVAATPVAHHDAIELPVALQNLVEHHAIMTIVLVVVEVVGTHDAPGLALGDGGTEGGQIDFMKCAVAHHDVHLMAILLVVVQRVVLHAGRHALRLQSLHVGHHHARGQPRVLAHVLEVAAGQRRAVDVDARTQYHVLAAIARFLAEALAVETRQIGVPRGSQAGQGREGHA